MTELRVSPLGPLCSNITVKIGQVVSEKMGRQRTKKPGRLHTVSITVPGQPQILLITIVGMTMEKALASICPATTDK